MAGLGETVAGLARLRRQRASDPARPTRARLSEVAEFGPDPGELRMLVHGPAGLGRRRPLVVVLHGCTQTAEQYAEGAGWIDLADRLGFALVCPEQRASNNPNRCFNWFEAGDTRRGQGEAASIRSMIETAVARFGSDPKQVFVTGLSAGGAMASVMLATYPEVFAGGGIVAGLPYGVANGAAQAFAAMFQDGSTSGPELGRILRQASSHTGPWPRISVWHGAADTTVKPSNADAIVQQWLEVHGLDAGASAKGQAPGHEVWSHGEVVVVERRLIAGMGHGTPLSSQGPDGVGRAGPFLLEAGVSSSLELLRFWGVAEQDAAIEVAAIELAAADAVRSPAEAPAPAAGPPGVAEPAWSRLAATGPANDDQGVGAIINRALRAAGLMK